MQRARAPRTCILILSLAISRRLRHATLAEEAVEEARCQKARKSRGEQVELTRRSRRSACTIAKSRRARPQAKRLRSKLLLGPLLRRAVRALQPEEFMRSSPRGQADVTVRQQGQVSCSRSQGTKQDLRQARAIKRIVSVGMSYAGRQGKTTLRLAGPFRWARFDHL